MEELYQALQNVKNAFTDVLMSKVSERLSGRRVEVYFRKPALKGARGFAFKRSGQAVIHVTPKLQEDETLKCFLHETAHIRLHWNILSEEPMWNLEPETVSWTDKSKHDKVWNASQKEDEVSQLAEEWFQYANNHAQGETLNDKLIALLEWK